MSIKGLTSDFSENRTNCRVLVDNRGSEGRNTMERKGKSKEKGVNCHKKLITQKVNQSFYDGV